MKRALDIIFSASALLLLAPFLAIIALAVRVALGAPVLFAQPRPGFRGRPFRLLKFRSMAEDRDGDGRVRPDAERLTTFGKLLRATSLDELPQLWNVLKGDMSLVGPRPLLLHYMDLYSREERRRHDVRPGITGWAQVNGRNCTTWPERFALDIWYVDNRSLWLDLRILALTVLQVFRARDISSAGSATMPEFSGHAPD
jgi:lipopolysaccharide/colanic/teichoic acid biosynthesis glycosyltransferase